MSSPGTDCGSDHELLNAKFGLKLKKVGKTTRPLSYDLNQIPYVKAVYCHSTYLTYAEYIVWNARLDETQAGMKIARRNINNLWYADDITLMAESEEELKSLLMKVKEENKKVGLKINI